MIDTNQLQDKRVQKHLLLFLVVGALCTFIDQVTKSWACAHLAQGSRLVVIPGILDFTLVKNAGAAFGLGQGAQPLYVFFCAAVVVMSLHFILSRPTMNPWLVAVFAAVCGGGIGNAIDRALYGTVTDFIMTSFMDFPVFNVADIFVVVGLVLLMIYTVVLDKEADHE